MRVLTIRPAGRVHGSLVVPGDKSISHRAVILGSIAEGVTTVYNLLEGEDVLCTIQILKSLGVKMARLKGKWTIEGRGLAGLRPFDGILYCGNSGTTLRLMTGLLAGLPFTSLMTGDASLNSRPMGRVMKPLQAMGARIEEAWRGKKRIIVVHGKALRGIRFKSPVASAQLKSALLLAGLGATGPVVVSEPSRSRDHSERMLKAFGAALKVRGLQVALKPGRLLKARKIIVPGDISSAAFFIVLGLISPDPGSRLLIRHVGLNPTRTGLLDVLKKMGGRISIQRKRIVCGEPVGDLLVRPSRLKGVRIGGAVIPKLIDEIPILAVAAALAKGKTVIRNAEELRIKETDRIHALVTELPKFGVPIRELKDGLEIEGTSVITAGKGMSHGDHRMAMSMAVLATRAAGESTIRDCDCIQTSFPTFSSLFRKVGGKIL